MKQILPVVLLSMLACLCFVDDKNEKPKPAQSVAELQQQLEKVLKETHTPGASVAIVHRKERSGLLV